MLRVIEVGGGLEEARGCLGAPRAHTALVQPSDYPVHAVRLAVVQEVDDPRVRAQQLERGHLGEHVRQGIGVGGCQRRIDFFHGHAQRRSERARGREHRPKRACVRALDELGRGLQPGPEGSGRNVKTRTHAGNGNPKRPRPTRAVSL